MIIEDRATRSGDEIGRYDSLLERRCLRIPLQHLTGVQEFYGRTYRVSPAVLIPRPETEVLVEAALRLTAALGSPLVVDVGTGSGCIALSVAAEQENARVAASDISSEALRVARDNARQLGLDARVLFYEGDLLDALPTNLGPLDVVLSNPPYVDPNEKDELMPEVADHEPPVALYPAGDALTVYRRLAPMAHARLAPRGILAVEVGLGQARAVSALLESSSFETEEVLDDLQGIPRVVIARRA